MDYTSYLIPESVKESCRDYISRLQKENKVYEDVKSRVNAFLIDESSQGEAITALKDRVSNYSAILATLILANEYDISDSYKFMNLVGDEIFDGSVILQAKQDAYDDWVEYGNNASNFRGKEKRATTQDEADSYRGQADNWDRMASEAKGSYDHFCKKEEKFDEIEEACSSLFLSSKELRDNANNLLKFINSGTDLKANAEDYAKYRQDLTAGYYGSDRTYGGNTVSSSNGQKVDFSMFWKDNHDSNMSDDEKDGVLEELKAKKAAYQKALEETDDPHQKDFFRGLIAGIDDSIEEVNDREQLKELYERREAYQNAIDSESDPHQKDYFKGLIADIDEKIKELDKSKPFPGDDKVFIKTTYTTQKMAALYEEKAALEKAIEMDPSQKNYLQARIDILENNIKTWVDYGLDNAKHEEEFRFVYEAMKDRNYSEEEILKTVSYFLWVDNKDNLTGREMPKWWRDEYLTLPDDLKVNEENVVDMMENEETRKRMEEYYFSTYYLVDCISGRPWMVYDTIDDSDESTWTTKDNYGYDAEYLRNQYLEGLANPYNAEATGLGKQDPVFVEGATRYWYDIMFGGMYDYAKGEDSIRAAKYIFEDKFGWGDNTTTRGVYHSLTNESTSLYETEFYAYLTKFDHTEDFVDNRYLDDAKYVRERQLIKYIKDDGNYCSLGLQLSENEKAIFKDARQRDELGAVSLSSYMDINVVANELEKKLKENLVDKDINVKVEGNNIVIYYAGGYGTYNGEDLPEYTYVIKPEGTINAFNGQFISYSSYLNCLNTFSNISFDNGWIEEGLKDHYRFLAEDSIVNMFFDGNELAAYKYKTENPEAYNSLLETQTRNEYQADLYADSYIYVDRKIEDAKKIWDTTMTIVRGTLLLACFLSPEFAPLFLTADAVLVTTDGAMKIYQGDTVEGAFEISMSLFEVATAANIELSLLNKAKTANVVEDKIDDAERLAQNVEQYKNVPDDEIDYYIRGNIGDPASDPKVLEDAVEDSKAVYGFKPNEKGSLKEFATEDWSDPIYVANQRKIRIDYIKENKQYGQIVEEMRKQGFSESEIAKSLVDTRNTHRLSYYFDEAGNIIDKSKYQQALEHCVSYEDLRAGIRNGIKCKPPKTDAEIIRSAMNTNPAYDACVGLYGH